VKNLSGNIAILIGIFVLVIIIILLLIHINKVRQTRELTESEEKFRALAAATTAGIFVLRNEKFLYINPYAKKLTGYRLEELYKRTIWTFIHPDSLEMVKEIYAGWMKQTEMSKRFEFRIITKQGESRWIDVTAGRFTFQGEPATIVSAFDITEKKKLTDTLAESEQRYRIINEIMSEYAYLNRIDQKGSVEVIWLTESFNRITGYTIEEAKDPSLYFKLLHPEDRAHGAEHFAKFLKGERVEAEGRIITKAGKVLWVSHHAMPIVEEPSGRVTYIYGVIRDITKRKLAEEAMLNSREDLSRLLNSIAEAAYGVDTNGNCTFVNREFLNILGYQNEQEILGKHLHELIHHSHNDGSPYPASECRMYKAYRTNQLVNVSDEVFWSKNGAAIPVEYRAHPIIKNGAVIGAIATFINITERRLHEKKILRQQQGLRTLTSELIQTQSVERKRLATYLHDSIGQSLSVARMKLDSITTSLSAKYPGAVQSGISQSGNEELLNQLNDLSNLIKGSINETRKMTFELSPPILYDLGLVPALDWLVGEMEKQHNLSVTLLNQAGKFRITDKVRDLLFDGTREMLMNVIKHAQATHVNVAIESVNSSVCVSVKDNGIGFDTGPVEEEHIDRKSFGLYNLRERLHNVGGNIEIESAPGKGTCAKLTAPVLNGSHNHLEK